MTCHSKLLFATKIRILGHIRIHFPHYRKQWNITNEKVTSIQLPWITRKKTRKKTVLPDITFLKEIPIQTISVPSRIWITVKSVFSLIHLVFIHLNWYKRHWPKPQKAKHLNYFKKCSGIISLQKFHFCVWTQH